MLQRKILTVLIYLSGAAAASSLIIHRDMWNGTLWTDLLFRLPLSAIPLLFVFAYPRFLFANSSTQKDRLRFAAVFNALGAAATTFFFPRLALPFWENPLRNDDSMALLLVPLIGLPLFLIAALFLLLKNRSSLATLASVMFWPYWFAFALASLDRWFQESPVHTAFYFLCFLSPALFAFAAGAVSYRPVLAHRAALLGLVGLPWIHRSLRDSGLGNVWLMFNLSGREIGMYPPLYAELTISAVALIALAIATAGLRLLPSRWQFRRMPLCERTWPAFAISLVVLAIWFSQSVMPYRIPGAVDGSQWPILQILYVEKRGLQFHETCVSVYGRPGQPLSVGFTGNNRRLFQYRFQETGASGQMPNSVAERVWALVHSWDRAKEKQDTIKPLRTWNVDGWYLSAEGVLKAYTTDQGATPPQEIIDLFRDLQKTPRSEEGQSEMRDVCLGFCYDPLSGLGRLYANYRCFNDGHNLVCR